MDQKTWRGCARVCGATAEVITIQRACRCGNVVFRRRPPRPAVCGIPTFLDQPYVESLDDLDIALIGVPMDLGVTNRPGARFGPRALRTIERVGPFNHQLKILPKQHHRIGDVGDVDFRSRYSLEQSIEDIARYFGNVVAAGVRPLAVGGDHSITYPILQAVGAKAPVGMVHIDAHCDTMGEMDGRSSIMADRSEWRCSTACWIHTAAFKSVFADRRSSSGSFSRLRHDGDSHRRIHGDGGRCGHRANEGNRRRWSGL